MALGTETCASNQFLQSNTSQSIELSELKLDDVKLEEDEFSIKLTLVDSTRDDALDLIELPTTDDLDTPLLSCNLTRAYKTCERLSTILGEDQYCYYAKLRSTGTKVKCAEVTLYLLNWMCQIAQYIDVLIKKSNLVIAATQHHYTGIDFMFNLYNRLVDYLHDKESHLQLYYDNIDSASKMSDAWLLSNNVDINYCQKLVNARISLANARLSQMLADGASYTIVKQFSNYISILHQLQANGISMFSHPRLCRAMLVFAQHISSYMYLIVRGSLLGTLRELIFFDKFDSVQDISKYILFSTLSDDLKKEDTKLPEEMVNSIKQLLDLSSLDTDYAISQTAVLKVAKPE